jgi:hypothetical protein
MKQIGIAATLEALYQQHARPEQSRRDFFYGRLPKRIRRSAAIKHQEHSVHEGFCYTCQVWL